MGKLINLTGQRFGRLIVVKQMPAVRRRAQWLCRCDCGAMKQRCQNPRSRDYKFYGLRGIRVCDAWQNYLTFRTWALANGYAEGLTIDRIDPDGNYEADNCRWITIQEQQKNRRPKSRKD